MKICPKCQAPLPDDARFCAVCGIKLEEQPAVESVAEATPAAEPVVEPIAEPVVEPVAETVPAVEPVVETAPVAPVYQQPVYTQPVYQQPVYQQPVYQPPVAAEPEKKLPSKAKSIVAMVLSIAALELVAAAAIFVGIMLPAVLYGEEVGGMVSMLFAGYSIVFCIFAFPLSLVGLILSNSCRKGGRVTRVTGTGKTLGLVSLILSVVLFVLSIFCVINVAETGDIDYYDDDYTYGYYDDDYYI